MGYTEPVYLASDDALSGGALSGGTSVRLRRVGVRSSARRVTDVGVVGAPPPVGVLGPLPAPVGVVEPCCIVMIRRWAGSDACLGIGETLVSSIEEGGKVRCQYVGSIETNRLDLRQLRASGAAPVPSSSACTSPWRY